MTAGPRTRSRSVGFGAAAASDAEKGAASGRRPAGRGKRRPRSLRSELPSMALLTGLYALQGVPLGLATGAIPFLLQAGAAGAAPPPPGAPGAPAPASAGLAAASTFAVAAWPYASKLAWAPIVDNVYVAPHWRRRSWILPTQAASAAMMWGGAAFASAALSAGAVRQLTAYFFALVAAAATQDIAVDGWALTLLSQRRVGVASTCQTLGTGAGAFLSFAGLVALSDPAFCARWLGGPPGRPAAWSLGGYLRAWGAIYAAATVGLLFVRERATPPPDWEGDDDGEEEEEGEGGGGGGGGGGGPAGAAAARWAAVRAGYADLARVAALPAVRRLAALLLAARLAVLPAEAAAALTLLAKGVPRDALAGLAAAQLPVEWAAAALAGRAAADASRPGGLARAWGAGYWARLACAAASAAVAAGAAPVRPAGAPPPRALLLAAGGSGLATAAAAALQFTCLGALYARVADPAQGGAYLTLLNTVANMGYALPKPLALAAVARWGLGPVSAVALAGGVALGALWLCAELAALEALPPGAWRVAGGGRGAAVEGRRASTSNGSSGRRIVRKA